ncbi:right-handed parallel beta-helix repeat-containing protein, partial [Nitrospirota bacterium]
LTFAIYKEDMEQVLNLIDTDSWARFAAFITLTHTPHYDSIHNWRLFYDPAKGRFEPIVWDSVGWHPNFKIRQSSLDNQMDIITSIIWERLHRNQKFLAAKHKAIEDFYSSGGDKYMMDIASDTDHLKRSAKGDRNIFLRENKAPRMLKGHGPKEIIEAINEFKNSLENVLSEVRGNYLDTLPHAYYETGSSSSFNVTIEDFVPIKYLEVDYDIPVNESTTARISYEKDRKRWTKDISQVMEKDGRVIRLKTPLFAGREMVSSFGIKMGIRDAYLKPATYKFNITSTNSSQIQRIRAGYADGKIMELERRDVGKTYPLDGQTDIVSIVAPTKEFNWDGDVLINGVREVNGNLTIKPGTTVSFAPDASLVVSGKLYAKGTQGKPIQFIPAKPGQSPWGALVLKGRAANGSVLEHCEFSSGSGLRHKYIEYSAMLSIHDVRDVQINNCTFAENKIVDDMVHAVYSEVTFKDCRFDRSLSDALDLDYVTGMVIGSRFTDSGNDALDLMSSIVFVRDSLMQNSGDKGISVGEGTNVLVSNTTIHGNAIGVQIKDRSKAVLYNVEMKDNTKTIDAYKKNWQYGDGGHAFVYKSHIVGGPDAITASKESDINIFDSYFAGTPGKKKKRIHLDSSVDSDTRFMTKARLKENYEDSIGLHESLAPYFKYLNPDVRGTLGK